MAAEGTAEAAAAEARDPNEVCIGGRLVARSERRLTPGGVAVTKARFEHCSRVLEADVERRVAFEFEAVALGAASRRIEELPLGAWTDLTGFLAPASRSSSRLVIHVTGLQVRQQASGGTAEIGSPGEPGRS